MQFLMQYNTGGSSRREGGRDGRTEGGTHCFGSAVTNVGCSYRPGFLGQLVLWKRLKPVHFLAELPVLCAVLRTEVPLKQDTTGCITAEGRERGGIIMKWHPKFQIPIPLKPGDPCSLILVSYDSTVSPTTLLLSPVT